MKTKKSRPSLFCITLVAMLFVQGCDAKVDISQVKETGGRFILTSNNTPVTGVISNYMGYCDLEVKNGLLHGKMSCKDSKGNGRFEREYLNGLKNGLYQVWHNNGQLRIREKWKDDLPDGSSEVFNDSGKVILQKFFSAGKENGTEKEWDQSGQNLILNLNWVNGKKSGFSNKDNEELVFKDDLIVGKAKIYGVDTAGKKFLKVETNYVDGKMDGDLKAWDEFGNETFRRVYKRGVVQSETKQLWNNKKLISTVSSIDVPGLGFVRHGIKKVWDENGILTEESSWEKGFVVQMFRRAPNGEMKKMEYVDSESGEVKQGVESNSMRPGASNSPTFSQE